MKDIVPDTCTKSVGATRVLLLLLLSRRNWFAGEWVQAVCSLVSIPPVTPAAGVCRLVSSPSRCLPVCPAHRFASRLQVPCAGAFSRPAQQTVRPVRCLGRPTTISTAVLSPTRRYFRTCFFAASVSGQHPDQRPGLNHHYAASDQSPDQHHHPPQPRPSPRNSLVAHPTFSCTTTPRHFCQRPGPCAWT